MRLIVYLILLGPILLGLGAILPQAAAAQVQCCNSSTGQWTPAADNAACTAQGLVPYTPENAAKVQVCFQAILNQAQQAIGQTGTPIPDMSGFTGGQMPNLAGLFGGGSSDPRCCDTGAGQWIGAMPAAQCQAAPGRVPDLPEFLSDTQACRGGQQSGGGQWEVEDYEDNLPNGGMEDWKDEHTPQNFASFGIPPGVDDQGFDMQTVFRSTDAHTGRYAARLKNFDIAARVREMQPNLPAPIPEISAQAGLVSCKDPCPMRNGQQAASGGSIKVVTLPIDQAESHICGAYKGYIDPRDELSIGVQLASGERIIGGINAAPGAGSAFTESAADWVLFSLPLNLPSASLSQANAVSVNAQVQPRNMMAGVMTSGTVGQVSNATDVLVDSIHFCDPRDLKIYHPEVFAKPGKEVVPETEEESLGGQTWVNLDNDDDDAAFDYEDTDGVAGDNELVKLRLNLPLGSRGKVELQVPGVGNKIALWANANKTKPFTLANQEMEVEELLAPNPAGTQMTRAVWIEGLKPSTSPKDILIRFAFDDQRANEKWEDVVALSILGLDDIVWEGDENSHEGKNDLDEDPNWPGIMHETAYRVFPGKKLEGKKPSAKAKDKVKAKLVLNIAPVRPAPIWLRAFDLDDPTAIDDEVDNESAAEDNRGDTPNRFGGFNKAGEIVAYDLEAKETRIPFQVTLQPGDNFRIAAGPDVKALEDLHNDDPALAKIGPVHTAKIVDKHIFDATGSPGEAHIREEQAWASDVLTVWRKLYIEKDGMGPVRDNEVTGTITSFEEAGAFASGTPKYRVGLSVNLYAELPAESQGGGGLNAYVDNFTAGRLVVDGVERQVISSTANTRPQTDFLIISRTRDPASTGTDLLNKPFVLRDDDVTRNGEPLPPIPMERLAPAFAPAYVLPVEDALDNPNTDVPFVLHYKRDDPDYLRSHYAFDNAALDGDPAFWVAYLLNAFQGILREDADGSGDAGAIAGQADSNNQGFGGYGATIYQESGRELAGEHEMDLGSGPQTAPGWGLKDAVPHEIGHLFGGTHRDGGLMDDRAAHKTEDFSPISLDLIRDRKHP